MQLNEGYPVREDGEILMHELKQFRADCAHSWHDEQVYLGCHAQWVTAESVNERLPIYDAEGGIVLTADAVIDNRDELFDRLGIHSSIRGEIRDSELILLAYRKWKENAPRYLVGDFAFVIWDRKQEILFGARDLFGNRTLYYHHHQHQRFAFCTTMAPLLALPHTTNTLHQQWLAEFMAIPVMFESSDLTSTVYRNIGQLPPAHTFTLSRGKLSLTPYQLERATETLKLGSNGEYEEAFRDLFERVVRSKMRTYRKVGATLSGGLDSGAVVSFAARNLRENGKPLYTYSYIPEQDFADWTASGRIANETPFIQATINHVGNIADHYLDLPGKSPLSEVDDWLNVLEMPYKYFENSFWIKGIFERAEEQGIGVLLTGARGNHTISWGPAVHYYALLLKQLRWIKLYREIGLYSQHRGIRRKKLISIIGGQLLHFSAKGSLINSDPTMPQLIHPEFARKTKVYERLQGHDSSLGGFMSRDASQARRSHLHNLAIANMGGTKGTKLSLRYGVTERDPTCDPRIVQFCLSVPVEQYVQDGVDRALIRRSTEGYLPDKVRLNQRIRGVQGADWVHRMLPSWPSFVEELQELCRDARVSELLNIREIKAALSQIGKTPRPEQAFQPAVRFLMRSLIIYRFMKKIV
nr:asparagine synthase-related protein [Paenibacillus oenotherae]